MTERLLFIPDCHVPYHDKKAFALMLRAAKAIEPHRIIILGDFADFFQVSFHERTLEKRMGFVDEVKWVNRELDRIQALGARVHFIEGNHEHRFNRYLANKAPELSGLPGMTVPELFHIKERGWTYTRYRDHLRVGKLWVTHDRGRSGPLAAIEARGAYGGNVVIGHNHAMTVAYKGDARGKTHVGASFGWLGDKKTIDYAHVTQAAAWSLGFGVGVMEKSGVVHLQAVPIVDGKCCVWGQVIS